MLKKTFHTFIVMIIDVLIVMLTGLVSLFIRFEFSFNSIIPTFIDSWKQLLPIAIAVTIVVFIAFRMYSFIWRFFSMNDAAKVVLATTVSNIIVLIISLTVSGLRMPLSVLFMIYVMQLLMFLAERCSVRLINDIMKSRKASNKNAENILLIGAGDAGSVILKDIQVNGNGYGHVVAVIDDNPNKQGKELHGVKIVGGRQDIPDVAAKYDITQIIIAITTLTAEQKRQILKLCNETGAKVKILPSTYQLYSGEVTVNSIRDVAIEDLLGRDPITLENDRIKDFISGRTILATGPGGSTGTELTSQIATYHPKKLVMIDCYENSIYDIQQELKRKYGSNLDMEVFIASVRDKERIYSIFEKYRPDVVYHAAAHKHVPLMEDSPSEAVKNNIFGTYHVIRAAEKYGVKKFVMISTDKAVNPTNVMGATKRFCEMVIQSRKSLHGQEGHNTEFACVRFGNVLGSNGSVIPLFKKQIAEGGPVTVTDKRITRFFMTIPEAVQLVLLAGTNAGQNQIFVLDMGEPVKIIDLAENLVRLSGKKPYIDIPIVEVGLRPGEKLYEELLMKSESLIPTDHKKIFIEEQHELSPETIMSNLERLDDAVTNNAPNEEIKTLLKEMIPTYREAEEQ